MGEITEEMIERVARALLALRGYRYAYYPEEYGQDAYTVTLGAREEARACLTAALSAPTPTPAASDWSSDMDAAPRVEAADRKLEARIAALEYALKAKTYECEIADGNITRLKAYVGAFRREESRADLLAEAYDEIWSALQPFAAAGEQIEKGPQSVRGFSDTSPEDGDAAVLCAIGDESGFTTIRLGHLRKALSAVRARRTTDATPPAPEAGR